MLAILTSKYVYYGLGILAIVGGIWFYGHMQYNSGYDVAETKGKLQIEQIAADSLQKTTTEINRQNTSNQIAQENAQKQIQQLETQKDDLQKQLDENSNEADKDPNSSRVGLGSDSVLRLNRIR